MKDLNKETSITFRTTKETKNKLEQLALRDNRSLSQFIELLLKNTIQQTKKK